MLVLKKTILLTLYCFTLSCAPYYRPRTREELKSLNLDIVPLPESLLAIPAYDGKEARVFFTYRSASFWTADTQITKLYNNGIITYQNNGDGAIKTAKFDIDSFQDIIFAINKLGYFSITYENIEKKKWVESRSCCFILFFGGMPRWDGNGHSAKMRFNLGEQKHEIMLDHKLATSIYDIEDVHIIEQCHLLIKLFLLEPRSLVFPLPADTTGASPWDIDEKPQMIYSVMPKIGDHGDPINGRVILKILIGRDGSVIYAFVQESSGKIYLDNAALEAIMQWQFTPPRRNDEPIQVWLTCPIGFKTQ